MSQVQTVTMEGATGAEGMDVVAHLHSNTWGLNFLGRYPYLSGGIDEEGQPKWTYWQDNARVETAVALIRAEARRLGATHLIDLKSNWISEWIQFTLLFWIAEAEVSATAIRVQGTPPAGAIPL